jgi:hypothetical protein
MVNMQQELRRRGSNSEAMNVLSEKSSYRSHFEVSFMHLALRFISFLASFSSSGMGHRLSSHFMTLHLPAIRSSLSQVLANFLRSYMSVSMAAERQASTAAYLAGILLVEPELAVLCVLYNLN